MLSEPSNPYHPPTSDPNDSESRRDTTRHKPRIGTIAVITAATAATTVVIGDRISPGDDPIQELIISMIVAIGLSWIFGLALYRYEQRRVVRRSTPGRPEVPEA